MTASSALGSPNASAAGYSRAPVALPGESCAAFLRQISAAHGERPALVFEDRIITYRALAAMVDRAKGAFAAAGIERGSRLGMILATTPDHVAWMLAAFELGAAVVPLYDSAPAAELRDKCAAARIDAVVIDPAGADRRRSELAMMAAPPPLLVVDGEPRTAVPSARPAPDDLAFLPFSSGTTGAPKLILLSHRNVLASRLLFAQATALDAASVLVHFLPLSHVYGWMALCAGLGVGAKIVLHARYDFDRLVADAERHRATAICAVSQAIVDLDRAGKGAESRLKSLRWINTGSAPLAPAIMQAVAARYGFPVTTGYGLTEAAPVSHTAVERPELVDVETVGFAVANTTLRLINPDDPDRSLAADAAGELVVAGPQVALGYRHADGRFDRESWLADGGFRTGDLVERDRLGRLRIVGRIKQIIKYKGYSIVPAELEAVLGGHPQVRDCAVLGLADAEAGEIPIAFVVARHQPPPSAEELIAHVGARVAPQRRLRKVVFVDQIPRTNAGKVLAQDLLTRIEPAAAEEGS